MRLISLTQYCIGCAVPIILLIVTIFHTDLCLKEICGIFRLSLSLTKHRYCRMSHQFSMSMNPTICKSLFRVFAKMMAISLNSLISLFGSIDVVTRQFLGIVDMMRVNEISFDTEELLHVLHHARIRN